MEKHPIDDLFSRKLSGLTKTPSNEVWKRLQKSKKVEKSRNLGWGRWMVAASLILFLVTGYLLEKSWRTAKPGAVVDVGGLEKESGKEVTPINEPVMPPLPVEKSVSDTKAMRVADKGHNRKGKETIEMKQPEVTTTFARQEEEDIASQEPLTSPSIGVVEKEQEGVSALTPVESNTQKSGGKAEKTETARVVIVHVSVEKEEAGRPSRFKRMLKQLQNVKDGEKVDWEEMGIGSRKVFAHAGNE